jgi:hypothetical protein
MRPIGFSTGALALSDFRLALGQNNYGDRIPIPRTPPPRRKILSLPLQTGANQPKVPIRKKLQLR